MFQEIPHLNFISDHLVISAQTGNENLKQIFTNTGQSAIIPDKSRPSLAAQIPIDDLHQLEPMQQKQTKNKKL